MAVVLQPEGLANTLSVFLSKEQGLYEDTNKFTCSFEQLLRYVRFLDVVKRRYRPVATELLALLNRRLDQPPGERETTPEDEQEYGRIADLADELAVDVESYFQFAKIVLDKSAHFIEDYFHHARAASLNSHHELTKNLGSFVSQKGLTLPNAFAEQGLQLQKLVSDYRDDRITHLKKPRVHRSVQLNSEAEGFIIAGYIYPKETEDYFQSPTVEDVERALKPYMTLLIELIVTNRDKGRYSLVRAPRNAK